MLYSHSGSIEFQNPEQGYLLVEIPGKPHFVAPLTIGRHYIGRAARDEEVSNVCKDFTGMAGWICLPKGNIARRCTPAGWINSQRGFCEVHSGWPREDGEALRILRNDRPVISGLKPGQKYPLEGFETIEFPQAPTCTMMYIPPVTSYSRWLQNDQVVLMETLSLWGSAGLGWFLIGDYERSIHSFENALSFSSSLQLRARLQLAAAQAYCQAKGNGYLQRAEELQRQALLALDLPIFETNVDGKVIWRSEPSRLKISGRNLSRQKHASNLVLSWRCPALQVYKSWDIGNVAAQKEFEQQYFFLTAGDLGRFAVEISLAYEDENNDRHEQLRYDFIIVRRPRPKIVVTEDIAIIDAEADESDDYPDVYGGKSIGSIWFRLRK